MHTGVFHLRRIAVIAMVMPFTVIGSVQAQSSCPLEDPAATSWLNWVLESDVMAAVREDMQLSHLHGQQLRVLGSDLGDGAICSTLYMRLSEEDRAALEQPGHQYRFIYYQIGDRYIQYYTSNSIRGVAEIEVFDTQFNLLARELSS